MRILLYFNSVTTVQVATFLYLLTFPGDSLPPPLLRHLAPLLGPGLRGDLSGGGGGGEPGGGEELRSRGCLPPPPGLGQLQPPEAELRGRHQAGPGPRVRGHHQGRG